MIPRFKFLVLLVICWAALTFNQYKEYVFAAPKSPESVIVAAPIPPKPIQILRVHWNWMWQLEHQHEVEAHGLRTKCLISRTRFRDNADYWVGDGPSQQAPHPPNAALSIWFDQESPITRPPDCPKFCNLTHFLWFHKNGHNFKFNEHWPSDTPNALRIPPPPEQKIKRILLVVTNCRSARMQVVKNLIPEELVDFCGQCEYGTPLDCPPRSSVDFYMKKITDKYRYIIVLENSLCPNYHTEKVLRAFYAEAIPILWNASRYAPDYELEAGLFYDLSSPNASKDDLRRFIEEDDLSRRAPGWAGIRVRTMVDEACRYIEQLYFNGNESSQSSDCMEQCQNKFQCANYPNIS